MYVATLTFTDGAKLYRAGDTVDSPSEALIAAGLVRETKTQAPEVAKVQEVAQVVAQEVAPAKKGKKAE